MTSKEAFKKIDWLIGQNISKLKFDKKCNSTNEMVSCLLIIQQDLERLEKLEKVAEILKKKRLSLVYFVYEIRADKNARNYSDYKYWAFNKVKSKDDLLAEDEFNLLLKEVFGNDKH